MRAYQFSRCWSQPNGSRVVKTETLILAQNVRNLDSCGTVSDQRGAPIDGAMVGLGMGRVISLVRRRGERYYTATNLVGKFRFLWKTIIQ